MNEPTVQDLLARVKAATDPSARAAALDAAWTLAESGTRYPSMDWRAILEAIIEFDPDRIRSCAQRVATAATSTDDIDTWGFAAAIVAFHRIGAEPDAIATLEIAKATLEQFSTRAYQWGLLAQGISNVDEYLPHVRALLARGTEVAAQRGDFAALSGIASHLHRIGKDSPGALVAQQQALELWRAKPGGEVRDVWTVASGWHSIDRLAERDAVLYWFGVNVTGRVERYGT